VSQAGDTQQPKGVVPLNGGSTFVTNGAPEPGSAAVMSAEWFAFDIRVAAGKGTNYPLRCKLGKERTIWVRGVSSFAPVTAASLAALICIFSWARLVARAGVVLTLVSMLRVLVQGASSCSTDNSCVRRRRTRQLLTFEPTSHFSLK